MKARWEPRVSPNEHSLIGLRAYIARFLPDATAEEAHRARILVLASLTFAIVGAAFFLFQTLHWIWPRIPPSPWEDLVQDLLLLFAGVVGLVYIRAGRLKAASWTVLGCLLALAGTMIGRAGDPVDNVAGGLVLLLFVALGSALLRRVESWLAFGLAAMTWLGLSLLWGEKGAVSEPLALDPASQRYFLVVAWLVIGGIVTAVVTSTMVVLRQQARLLRDHVTQLQSAEDALRSLNLELEDRIEVRTAELAQEREHADAAREAAEAATRAKSAFLATVSHEVRTPMSAVLGMVYLALHSDPSPGLRHYLTGIQTSAQTMLAILNDLLDTSKIEAGKLELETIPFTLKEVFDHILMLTRAQGEEKGLDIHYAIGPDVPAVLVGDPLRLEQVLANLATNAVKFTDQGEIVLAVTLLAQEADHLQLRFSVRDTGIGMTAEEVSRLFHAFSQSDSSITRRFGGTGLGLLICRELVSLMGGEIWVASAPGRGSNFIFTAAFGVAPRVQSEEILARQSRLPGASAAAEDVNLSSYALCGAVVLVAEDSAINQEVVSKILEMAGVGVVVVSSGAEVLAALAQRPFDALLLDIELPEMDGYEVARAIRASTATWRDIPIIAMTGRARPEDRDQSLAAGMDDHIVKPLEPLGLCAILSRWIGSERAPTAPAPPASNLPRTKTAPSVLPKPDAPAEGGAVIDVEAGLARVSGDRALYYSLLQSFIHYHQTTADAIRAAQKGHDMAGARKLTHKLKGAAATIGAERLCAAADALEAAARKAVSTQVDSLVDQLVFEMDEVLRRIAEVIAGEA